MVSGALGVHLSLMKAEHPEEKAGRTYARYKELGGIINENDYAAAFARAERSVALDPKFIAQSESIASFAGIALHNSKEAADPRAALYVILRSDMKPEGVAHHHSQMSDQRLFAEAVRMAEDTDALQKLIAAYPNIAF